MWLKQILDDLNRKSSNTIIHCDNQSTICIAKNPELHGRSKHINVRYHFVREKIENKELEVIYLPTEKMVADVLTKGLPKIKHYLALDMLGLNN